MAVRKYAIVRDGVVISSVVWDGDAAMWQPPIGHTAIPVTSDLPVGVGWHVSDDGTMTPPTVMEPPVEASVPRLVTMRQARLALLAINRLGDVPYAIDTLTGNEREMARVEWEYSAVVERHSPAALLVASALGIDDKALDDLFIAAAKL